ncbi:unnamed protein product [Litomosoides sigmodontis]|uniref:Rho-GAP domain-containing protein n=1 Tax=Litomosoides sigmodontis TaxID=42156 RepID=A0A3P6TK58_LITSI|nr:unnamed protein product [Litomosoides sigmodontis]
MEQISGCSLPEDVVRKIHQVDQQSSTLTSSGITGFSARILDKSEYRMEKRGAAGTGDIIVVQLVEIIKKPGQSLGLYLREGNGTDRSSGVFASRFGDNSELEKYGDIIRPGDEILSVNNVDVSAMSIDDVVLVLSIPRRLLLRIRYIKNKRERMTQSQSMVTRPVVVFQRSDHEQHDDTPSSTLLNHPTSTANTWLGKKARQQQEMAKRCLQPSSAPSSSAAAAAAAAGVPSLMTMSPRQHLASRRLNSQAEKLEETVSRTARVPPPKLLPSTVLPSYTYSIPRSLAQRPVPIPSFPGPSTAPDYLPASSSYGAFPGSLGLSQFPAPPGTSRPLPPIINQRSLSDVAGYAMHHSLCSPPGAMDPRYLFRGQSAWHSINPSDRSNSLPRRRAVSGTAAPRTVKWRNDVIDGANSRTRSGFGGGNMNGHYGRTINDIFSAQEYRNWACIDTGIRSQERQSRWSHTYGEKPGASIRSSSLPSRAMLNAANRFSLGHERGDLLDRLHVSPLMNRRVPLRAAGPGFDVDTPLDVSSLTGILVVQIVEGRGLKMPEKQKAFTEEMYCVLEVNETHRARTGVSTAEQKFRWRETFEIDVQHATHTNFFVYSWHPQYRHKLCHKGSLKLLEAFVVDRLNGNRMFALNLEPKGQLIVRIAFYNVVVAFRRIVNCRYDGIFGIPLQQLVAREGRETPLVLSRLLQEIEQRDVDYSGLYILCGSLEKKRMLREELELNVERARLSVEAVPDTNVLASLVKDFLRELPEPLVSTSIYSMIVEAFSVALPNDPQGNRRLLLRVIDCLPAPNKNTLVQIMDHLKMVMSSEQHNGVSAARLTDIFGCLLFCSCNAPLESGNTQGSSDTYPPKTVINPLDTDQAARTLRLLVDIWPSRVNDSDSSGSGSGFASSSTDVTSAINPVSESQC